MLHRDFAGAEAELRALARKMPRQLALLGSGAVADKISVASSLPSVTKLMLRVNSVADAITALARCPPRVTELHLDMTKVTGERARGCAFAMLSWMAIAWRR